MSNRPLAMVVPEMMDHIKFRDEWGIDMSEVYDLDAIPMLPFDEGPVDDKTFVRYGIITAVNYRDAVQRYSGQWRGVARQRLQALREPVEAVQPML